MATSTSSWIMEDDPLRSAKRTSNKRASGNYSLYNKNFSDDRENPSDRYIDNNLPNQTKIASSSPLSQSAAPLATTSRQLPTSSSEVSSSLFSSFRSSGSHAINSQQQNDPEDNEDEIINFRGKRRISFHQRLLALHKSRRQRKRGLFIYCLLYVKLMN